MGKFLDRVLPWVFLISAFFIAYNSFKTGQNYKDALLYGIIALLYFKTNKI